MNLKQTRLHILQVASYAASPPDVRKVSDFPTGFALKSAARLSLAALLEKRGGKAELFAHRAAEPQNI